MTTPKKIKSQKQFILQYYQNNPNRPIPHPEIVDWATAEYQRTTGKKLRDPDRMIRSLHQDGWLIKEEKGIYLYNPKQIFQRNLEDFTQTQKNQILERDNHRCVICGRGPKDGIEIHVDHIKPKEKGGKAEITNGQTLCAEHNYRKKTYSQTESGKRMFIRLHQLAQKTNDQPLKLFCEDILKVYNQHNINGHIEWNQLQTKNTA